MGGENCFLLVIYGFCINKVLYSTSHSLTMFIGQRAWWVLQNKVSLSFSLSEYFLGIGSLVYSKFWHAARNPNDRIRFFLKKRSLLQTLGKWVKFRPKIGLFKFYWKRLVFDFYWIYNENLCHLLCFCTWCMFGKKVFPEIWAKMLSVNQIAVFLNERNLPNKSIKKPDFFAC